MFCSQLFGWMICNPRRHYALLFVVMATMSFQGVANVQQQRTGVRPEFDSEHVEKLVHWINQHTEQSRLHQIHTSAAASVGASLIKLASSSLGILS